MVARVAAFIAIAPEGATRPPSPPGQKSRAPVTRRSATRHLVVGLKILAFSCEDPRERSAEGFVSCRVGLLPRWVCCQPAQISCLSSWPIYGYAAGRGSCWIRMRLPLSFTQTRSRLEDK
jgi:hypothetical protein